MWQFQGFATKSEEKKFQKENGGGLYWAERTPKRKALTTKGKDYMLLTCEMYDGYREKYPYIVAKRI